MLKFYVVETNRIQQTWNEVEPMLAKAMAHSGGEYSLEQLKVMLTQGRQVLCVGTELDDLTLTIKCAMTIEWINYPNDRVAFITAIGGKTDKCKVLVSLKTGFVLMVVQRYREQLLKQ
jgi:hypothetical protein